VEVANIFKLGTRFSQAMGCNYLDKDGLQKPIIMGSYGIGSGRLLACIAEEHHDEAGLIWPISIAPYAVHLIALGGRSKPNEVQGAAGQEGRAPLEIACEVYNRLTSAGLEVLFDDREESPGVKFNDADLIGLPLRLTVGERSLKNGGLELKRRDRAEKTIIPLADILPRLQAEIAQLQAELLA
jgi:prolyl-tRNA synthetase